MAEEKDVAPVSGSDDARSSPAQADRDRDEAVAKAERALHPEDKQNPGTETESHRLAKEYLRLGGKRKAKIDDNITDVRSWEKDPPEAEQFWRERVESLSEGDRKQVEDFLPTINSP